MNKGRQPFYNSRRKEEKTAPQKAEKRHYGLAMRDELFNEPLIADAPHSFMDSPPWKKCCSYLQNVCGNSRHLEVLRTDQEGQQKTLYLKQAKPLYCSNKPECAPQSYSVALFLKPHLVSVSVRVMHTQEVLTGTL